MNLLTKIRAFFKFKGEKVEMELSKAEIKQGRVYLHPADKPSETFMVKTKCVDLIINPEEEIRDDDVIIVNDSENKKQKKAITKIPVEGVSENTSSENNAHNQIQTFFPKKRKFVVSLYPDEYESIIENINTNGYKRAEYLLACVNSAKKTSFDAMYKKFAEEHKERYKLEKSANNS